MWLLPLYIIIIGLLAYLTAATVYLMVLAVAYFVLKEPETVRSTKLNRFAILIPAHNEELLISHLCESLLRINYPKEYFEIFIIADNCNDRTAEIWQAYTVKVLTRSDPSRTGKGFALNWALERIALENLSAI